MATRLVAILPRAKVKMRWRHRVISHQKIETIAMSSEHAIAIARASRVEESAWRGKEKGRRRRQERAIGIGIGIENECDAEVRHGALGIPARNESANDRLIENAIECASANESGDVKMNAPQKESAGASKGADSGAATRNQREVSAAVAAAAGRTANPTEADDERPAGNPKSTTHKIKDRRSDQ